MERLSNWQSAMHAHVKEVVKTPFEWGTHDCCTHVVSHIKTITGVDVGAEFAGKYSSELSAMKTIKAVTGGSTVEDVADHVTKQHEMTELSHVNFAHLTGLSQGNPVTGDNAITNAQGLATAGDADQYTHRDINGNQYKFENRLSLFNHNGGANSTNPFPQLTANDSNWVTRNC